MKLRQNGIVSLMIRPAVFLAGGSAYMKLQLLTKKPRGVVRYMQGVIIVLVVVLVLVLEIKGTKTASRTMSTNRMTNKIGVPQPIFSSKKFLFRSDWTLAASGDAYMKLYFNSWSWF
jgi:hypothetical protein